MSKRKLAAKIVLLLELKKLEMESETENPRKNREIKQTTAKRKYWVKPLLIRRCNSDLEAHLLKDILWQDNDKDLNKFCPLDIQQFEEILNLVEDKITKNDTQMRAAITARTKLAIVLRYLATGDSFSSLEFLTRVSSSTISVFMPSVTGALCEALKSVYLKIPDSEEEWQEIVKDFGDIWQFPHTLGALEGKHIRIKATANTAAQFYNIKGYFSIVLFVAVDAHGRFILADVGSNGKDSDSKIYQDSYLCNSLENGNLHIPKNKELIQGQCNKMPYFFIADNKFCLDKHLMKPYSSFFTLNTLQEQFNQRLNRARMVVDYAFGRLAKRFGIFKRPLEAKSSTVNLIVMTTCILHNYLTKKHGQQTITPDFVIEKTPETFSSIGPQENETHKYANKIRDEISRYLVTDEIIPIKCEL